MKVTRKSSGSKIVAATQRGASRLVADGVAVGEQVARQLSRVDTGFMQEHTVGSSDGKGTGKLESTAHYAFYNEFGTSKMSAQPFFRPGRDTAIRFIKKGMKIFSK